MGSFTSGKDPVPIIQKAGWAPGTSGLVRKISPPTGIRSPDRPARRKSLYRLSCRGPHRFLVRSEKFPFLPNVWGPSISLVKYRRTPLSEVRRSKGEAEWSPPFNEGVKDEVSYACTTPYVFRDENKPTKTLTLTNKSTNNRSVERISLTRHQYSVSPRKLLWFVHSFCSRISRKCAR